MGQTTTTGDGGAGSFAGANQPPPIGDPNQVVPGMGSSDALNAYGEDPQGLIAAGEANAPGNQYLEVLGGGAVNAARYDLSNNDDWLKRSFDILNDAEGHTGGLTDDATTSCRAESGQKTKTETSLYTCESGQASYDEQESCSRTYQPIFDTDYLYKCLSGTQWRAVAKTCEPERVVVVDEDYVYSCRTGTVWTHTPASCERKRIVVVDEDYKYGCVKTWNGSTHAPNAACNANGQPGCAPSGGQVCAAPSGLPSSYTCKEGFEGSSRTESCSKELNVTVRGRWTYTWVTGQQGANQQEHELNMALGSAGCRAEGSREEYDQTEVYFVCTSFIGNSPSLPYGYAFLTGQAVDGVVTDWVNTQYCAAANDSSCRAVGTTCTGGSGNRVIDGQTVYQECWGQTTTYQCGSQTSFPGCSPPAGMTQNGSNCIARDNNGVCTGTEKTFIDPSGGCSRYEQDFRCEDPVVGAGTPSEVIRDVVSDTWDNGCNALAGNGACVKQGEIVIEGNATKVINGLPVTRNPWHVREDYICSSSSNVNSCSPFTGCTQQAQTCASKDRAGNCTAYDRTYRCENPANDGGTPIETPRDIVGEYWTDPCAANRNDPSCRKTNDEVLIGNETRVINGLSVTRNPWKRRETWTCDVSNPVETCGPVKTCELVGESCAGTDPKGACSATEKTYRCENRVPGAGEPSGEVTDHVGGDMQGPSCRPATDTTCRKKETTCTQPGETRIINGVPTTAPCWEETDTYICEKTSPETSNCKPASGCEFVRQECLDGAVGSDQCRTFENIYQCKKEVLVEETKNTCQTKVCIGSMCIGQDDEGDTDLPDALAAMLIAQMAGEDYSKNMTIFKGQPMRCRKAVLGFRNCCKDSGWGVDIGLTQCSAEEETLMTRQEAKSTHYVGTYCSQKSFLGVCLEKAMRYCSFDGTLARIVQEHGRPQIGKGWGTPKDANCDGFTVEEFEKLDLTDADFSDFTDDAMKKIMNPDQNSTLGRIQQNISNLMGSGSPGIGDVDEAGNP
nr:conjugal transfer protein TraN [Brevundimonas diminuta]